MSEKETQLPPSPEQMALDITTALISAGYFKSVHEDSHGTIERVMRQTKTIYRAALAEFK